MERYNSADYNRRLSLVGITYNQIESGVYALILEEVGGKRRIPIIIGYPEAQAIECKLQEIMTPRPLTHDLITQMLTSFNATLQKITIRRLDNGVFAAYLHIKGGFGEEIIIDARSSDAIAIAIRVNAPIFTSEQVLDDAGFSPDKDKDEQSSGKDEWTEEVRESRQRAAEDAETDLNLIDSFRLKEMLQKCVEEENYEEAAKIQKILESRDKE